MDNKMAPNNMYNGFDIFGTPTTADARKLPANPPICPA